MQHHPTMETRRLAGFPADVLVALILPAFAIFAAVFGPQRTWMLLVVAGFVQLSAGLSVLRRRSSSVVAWGCSRRRHCACGRGHSHRVHSVITPKHLTNR